MEWDSEVLEFHEFPTARLPVEDIYAVQFSIIGLFKFVRKVRKRFNGPPPMLWIMENANVVLLLT